MKRRAFLLSAAASLSGLIFRDAVGAQPAKLARIGFLGAISASGAGPWVEALRAGLRDLGYAEGRNIAIEYRWADGKYESLPRLAAELLQQKVDVIVAAGTTAIQAAQRATPTIPIVMLLTADPVGAGFVASLSRPARNITGLSNINVDVSGKYLELLRIAIPQLARVAVLVNPGHPNHPAELKNIQAAGVTSGVSVSPVQAATVSQIEVAFGTMTRERAGALIVLPDSLFHTQPRQIAELAAKIRLPTMLTNRESVEAGGLMSYGPDLLDQFRRAATYVDKILKGAKPADLPVEQPTKLELVVNLKTAKMLGLTMPHELLVRATRVIE